jgi:hypothetical protein
MNSLNKKVLKVLKKKEGEFYCNKCDYTSSSHSNYKKHVLTRKHILNASLNEKYSDYTCEFCNKTYKNRNGLWYHKKKCNVNNGGNEIVSDIDVIDVSSNDVVKHVSDDDNMYKEMFLSMVHENKEMRKTIHDLIPRIGDNNVTNMYQSTTTNHNHFNMNIFLNTQCKNALNLADFVQSLQLQVEDLENNAKYGFVEGMSKIFIRGLQALDVYKRPIHCSDGKRDTLYVKENDAWNREEDDYKNMKDAIVSIKRKNLQKMDDLINDNPDVPIDNNQEMQYLNILSNSIGSEENKDRDFNKIIKNVAKEVLVDKKNTL